jgi:GMP synthase (glutamine-hydrolysing)
MTVRVAFLTHSEWDLPGVLGERARELGFSIKSCRADRGEAGLPATGTFDLLVVMGSARSATDPSVEWIGHERRMVARAVESDVPVLGVCFGGQLLAQVLGGHVDRAPRPEFGWRLVDTADADRIPPGPWLVWHEDRFSAPPGADQVARTEVSLHAFVLGIHTGVQFHPEVDRDMVRHWVAEARAEDTFDTATAAELQGGFGPDGRRARGLGPPALRRLRRAGRHRALIGPSTWSKRHSALGTWDFVADPSPDRPARRAPSRLRGPKIPSPSGCTPGSDVVCC